VQLAAVDGARMLASAAGRRDFAHQGLHEGDEVDLGGLILRALATPGHTGEHLSFELLDGSMTVGVFTGGSLIVGGAARTDLVGADRTEELTRLQYRSLQRLTMLPDATKVWPTHGAGSFCSAPRGGDRISTIGQERNSNPLLTAPDEDTFVERLLSGLGSFPPYFLHLAEANRRGPALTHDPTVAALDAAKVSGLVDSGAVLIDVRPVRDFAAGHIPGALSMNPAHRSWWSGTPTRTWPRLPGRPSRSGSSSPPASSPAAWRPGTVRPAPRPCYTPTRSAAHRCWTSDSSTSSTPAISLAQPT
jgi:hydroxyacylglutathione hydrolase